MAKECSLVTMDIHLEFTEELLGGISKDPNLFSRWILEKKGEGKDELPSTVDQEVSGDQTEDEMETEVDEEVETAPVALSEEEMKSTGFHSDDHGLFVYDYFLKGFFKEVGNTLKKSLDVSALRGKIVKNLFVEPRRIHIMDASGNFKEEPDGTVERPIQIMGKKGPRQALAKSDKVDAGSTLDFSLKLYPEFNPKKWQEIITSILGYGSDQALGQFRTGGYGKIRVRDWEIKIFPFFDTLTSRVPKPRVTTVDKNGEEVKVDEPSPAETSEVAV